RIPTTQLAATSSTASPIATCTEQPALIRIRNTGDPAVYSLVARETLPAGILYVPGTTRWRKGSDPWQVGGDPTIVGATLEWTELEVAGLAELRSRETLEIEFGILASCSFTGGNLVVSVDYLNVCSEPGTLPAGAFRLDARRPSLSVNKVQISPSGSGPIDCGGEVTWRIDVTNTGPIPIPYAWVEDELGDGFTYVSSTGGIYGVDDGCSSGSTVTWALENLPPGGMAQLTLTAEHTSCGDLSNTIRAWWGCGADSDGSSCTPDDICLTGVPATLTITASRDPSVTLSSSLDPGQVPSCDTTTFTLTVTNPSTARADAVDVRIALPAGLAYVPGSTEIDCGSGFFSASDPVAAGGFLYWYDPNDPGTNLCAGIPAGGTVRLRFRVQASCYRTTGNAGIVVYYYDCCGLTQRQTTGSRSLAPAVPNLTITKTPATVPLDCYDPGSTVTWQIRVQNTGGASADWVRVEDTLGASLQYLSSSPLATPMGAQKWGWEFGPLGPGESRTFEITVRLSQPSNDCASALRTNTASVWWGCGPFDGDPNTTDGCTGGGPVTATARATIPDLTLTPSNITPVLTCVDDGIHSGRVTIVVRNTGDAPVTGDFRMRVEEAATGWWREGYFGADFGGTLPVNANSTRTIHVDGWPVSCQSCTYRFTVTLDLGDDICECIEGNNANSRDWTITLPDLTVRRENLALTCAGDGLVLISGTVTLGNEGCGTALTANVPMRFVLHDGAGCSGTVLHTWTETFSGVSIPAGGERTFTVGHTFPIDLCTEATGCTVSLLIEADHTGSICECDGTNNTLCTVLPVEIPDLAVVAVEPNVPDACSPGRVEVTVANVGCVESPAGVVVRITGAATGEITLPAIPAGDEATVTVDLNQILPCGAYTITARVDPDDVLCECSDTSNALEASFTVVDPDLTITDLRVECRGDGSFAVSAVVRNVGTEDAPPTAVRIYVDGALFATVAVPALAMGEGYTVSYVTPRIKCGVDHVFRLVVDEGDLICECNEANNEVETLARCGCPALVTQKSVAQILRGGVPVATNVPVEPGDLVTYTLTVTNVGAGWAFNVDVWDELPVEFAYVAGSTSAAWPGGSSSADPSGAPGPSLAWDLGATLLPGEALTLSFQALVTSLARQGRSYTNTMGATGEEGNGTPIPPDSGLPGDDDPDDSAPVVHPATVPALALDKAIADVLRAGVSRGPTGPVEPGDVIVYTVTVRNVGGGTAYNVDFADQIPAHTEYETAYGDGLYTVDSPPAGPASLGIPDGATGLVTADTSATINPGGTLSATYRVRVLSAVSQGVDLVNYAVTSGKDGAGAPIPEYNPDVPDTYPDRDATRIPVVEPGLALDKEIADVLRGGVSVWPTPIVLWGDVIVYRVTVRNVGLGTAYNVDLTDNLPFGLAYDAGGDGTYTVDSPPSAGSLGIPDGTTGLITASISAQVNSGGTLVVVYRARVLPEA
ncbi:MAG: hypothetical protein NUV94_07975, partial [Candidatus Acetothermia bacterium]|nr:hypothetical protein [Candidatus Acetothermia bacterium]